MEYLQNILILLFHSLFCLSCKSALALVDGVGASHDGGVNLTKMRGYKEREAVKAWNDRYIGSFSLRQDVRSEHCGYNGTENTVVSQLYDR